MVVAHGGLVRDPPRAGTMAVPFPFSPLFLLLLFPLPPPPPQLWRTRTGPRRRGSSQTITRRLDLRVVQTRANVGPPLSSSLLPFFFPSPLPSFFFAPAIWLGKLQTAAERDEGLRGSLARGFGSSWTHFPFFSFPPFLPPHRRVSSIEGGLSYGDGGTLRRRERRVPLSSFPPSSFFPFLLSLFFFFSLLDRQRRDGLAESEAYLAEAQRLSQDGGEFGWPVSPLSLFFPFLFFPLSFSPDGTTPTMDSCSNAFTRTIGRILWLPSPLGNVGLN